jgi:hypothetical protein
MSIAFLPMWVSNRKEKSFDPLQDLSKFRRRNNLYFRP